MPRSRSKPLRRWMSAVTRAAALRGVQGNQVRALVPGALLELDFRCRASLHLESATPTASRATTNGEMMKRVTAQRGASPSSPPGIAPSAGMMPSTTTHHRATRYPTAIVISAERGSV